jgi:hypothetical protein
VCVGDARWGTTHAPSTTHVVFAWDYASQKPRAPRLVCSVRSISSGLAPPLLPGCPCNSSTWKARHSAFTSRQQRRARTGTHKPHEPRKNPQNRFHTGVAKRLLVGKTSAVKQPTVAVAAAWLLVSRSVHSPLVCKEISDGTRALLATRPPPPCCIGPATRREQIPQHCTGLARLLAARCPVSLCACVLRSTLRSTLHVSSSATSPVLSRLRHFHARLSRVSHTFCVSL